MDGEIDVSTAAEKAAEMGTITVSPALPDFPRPGNRADVDHLNQLASTDEKRRSWYMWHPPAQRTEH